MPHSVNGIGTGLVKASRERKIDGYVQFDAIEALILFYIPIIPYKAIHVLSIWQDEHGGEKYDSIQLRPSGRFIAKAMFNGWGNVLLIFAGITLLIAGWAFISMSRPMNIKDWMCLGGLTTAFIGGFFCKSIWYLMNETDERIKDIIGPHDLGTSDPVDWSDEIAQSVIKHLMAEANGQTLVGIANQALAEQNRAKAMLCVRLAMRGGQNPVAQKLFDQLMASV
ncbi:MAG TPA: hypothetical protein PKZ53_09185 [Acidobacteriota bacterium]|nr:hypothetical protein [Acidobacteriota bacterium]HNB70289.1 hypothetical protein [Acidobacteriota bacterium]HNG93260.1 hypothetical protein [Acidobacteriota bacterium]HNJ40651.1 hypothetical protein [Acidobacteriota bacterium]